MTANAPAEPNGASRVEITSCQLSALFTLDKPSFNEFPLTPT